MSVVDKEIEKRILKDENVVGWSFEPTGELIFIVKDKNKFESTYPAIMSMKNVKVYITDEIKALRYTNPFNRKSRQDILAGGISIGHYKITAGTLSTIVKDKKDGNYVLLSNWHVFGDPDGKVGDPIYQPGPYDGGKPADTVGKLKRWVPFDKRINKVPWWKVVLCWLFGWVYPKFCEGVYEPNLVDAAIATHEAREIIPSGIYLDDGSTVKVKGWVKPELNMEVWKSGRSSGVNTGRILATSANVWVNYGYKVRLMRDQIITTYMARPGDSGSLLISKDGYAVGLLFAGSTTITVHCKWSNVEKLLEVEIP